MASHTFDPSQYKYTDSNRLGEGGFGSVHRISYQVYDRAVKRILKSKVKEIEIEHFFKDDMRHENLVTYLAKGMDDVYYYLVLELCAGTLLEFVNGDYEGPSPGTMTETLIQATKGLRFLHAKKVVHRDIKPHNILIALPQDGENPKVKLADFGLCKQQRRESGITFTGGFGTKGWAAAELMSYAEEELQNEASFTLAVDIFSFGCVYAFCLTKHHPFGDGRKRLDNILEDTIQWTDQDKIQDGGVKRLIKKMISKDPNSRPTLKMDQLDDAPIEKLEQLFLPDYSSILDKLSNDYQVLLKTIAGTYIGAGKDVQVGVAWLIKNRLNAEWFDTLAEVCLQQNQFVVLQKHIDEALKVKEIRELDDWLPAVYVEYPTDPTGGATHCYPFRGRYRQSPPDCYNSKIGDHRDISYMRFFRC